jgi:hypothetical protein
VIPLYHSLAVLTNAFLSLAFVFIGDNPPEVLAIFSGISLYAPVIEIA